ncbi:unnamed protein product [Mucor circinelloides]|uniref:Uncharacterized protein n=1 Tax=Mucor circinelloides f. circinelloides (strain 1006PhL) TaxID=1220926 RepID=S2JNV4_MUCC1|nr:hypothetical protein HMPREF1544_08958 [Mucor circinelloides 1006PhL]KAG1124056.1 hypothetical protein G6F42_009975 [Rhizopus arrhizus]
MNQQQPSSGDLKDLQRQHQVSLEKSPSNHSSNNDASSIRPPSLFERRQSSKLQNQSDESPLGAESLGAISPMPTGAERMAALRDLGATFEEGQKSIAKVATPTETVVPSFVDSDQLEVLLHKKNNPNLTDTCKDTVAH